MGVWHMAKVAVNVAKFAATTALDHIEGKEAPPKYKLHPDSAYLGNKYYSTDTHLAPQTTSSRAAAYSRRPAAPVALPSLGTSPSDSDKKQTPSTNFMKPHVHIGRTPVHTPSLKLLKEKYTVLRHSDLIDDDIIDETVGRDRDLYWVIKGAVVLMVKERSEAASTPPKARKQSSKEAVYGASIPPHKTYKSSKEATKEAMKAEDGGTTSSNPLNSPSVEDFFAGIFDIDQCDRIDGLPPNPLAKTPHDSQTAPCTAADKQAALHPLDHIPRNELVIIFRHDTKELFVRKPDGKLYPVIWGVRAIRSHLRGGDDASPVVGDVKFTNVEGEMDVDDEGFVDVEYV
ncbi:uncharacterized protein N0V89_010086 [Didymosphaeria variabile]|uniref:Uncharacterized protein n=1 Tax=Didymosphaeria variabile TaxID=1932322 RepID=A0A9W8XEK0_9PLEO|nr:uncharacterized protein N0V89_010086 [Didymosphaeria variabile]KAJ4348708.1 hypothetical protein N0V89_010086 [Didymosphaeria variabile]